MPTPDLIQGVNLPTFGDAPAVPTDIANSWYAGIARAIPRFANASQRETAYPTPSAGQFAWVGNGLYHYVGGAWKFCPGVPVSSTADVLSPTSGMTCWVGTTQHYYTGTTWVAMNTPTSYTPTLTGFTIGSGTLTARWTLLPGLRMSVEGRADYSSGSGTLTGTLGWGLPSGWTIDPSSPFGTLYGGATARPSAASGSNFHKGWCYNNGQAARVGMISGDGAGSTWDATVPSSTITTSPGFIGVRFEVPVVPA